jgi:BlaI family transcriptional regulator, penicillinase repressor
MSLNTLNQNELEALRILWEEGELKPADIQSRFGWPMENATLRSVLVNLVAKGQIRRRRQGKAYYYAARVPKATMLQGMMGMLSRVFAGGSSRALVAQLVETGDIKPSDLKAIRDAASESSTQKTKGKTS